MTNNSTVETRKYLEECHSHVQQLSRINSTKKKTLKQKAFHSLLLILESRLKAKIAVLQAAIGDDSATVAGVHIQKSLYGDIIEFLIKELTESEKPDAK